MDRDMVCNSFELCKGSILVLRFLIALVTTGSILALIILAGFIMGVACLDKDLCERVSFLLQYISIICIGTEFILLIMYKINIAFLNRLLKKSESIKS